MIFDQNGITLQISNRKITRKSPNIWKQQQQNTSKQSVGQKRLKGNKKFIELSEIENRTYQQYWAFILVKWKFYIHTKTYTQMFTALLI